ncbi:MAG TPA: DegV family protein [Thermoanaerobaculia bacterium]
MPRHAVLVVDPDRSRRRELSHGLTGFGYEVIPAIDAEQGTLFAGELGPGIVVAPAALAANGGPPITERFAAKDPTIHHTLLLLGGNEQEGRDLPEEVLFLATDGIDPAGLVRRIHLALLGREIGLEPDAQLESLVGDFSLHPLLELLRGLNRAHATGQVACAGGKITLENGEVVGAEAGRVTGIKAFCRLSHLDAGPFWVRLRPPDLTRPAEATHEIRMDLRSLIFLALEDAVHDAPDPRSRVRVQAGPSFSEAGFTPGQQELLAAAPGSVTVGRLLDALPATDGEVLRDLMGLRELGVVALEEPRDLVRVVTDSTSDLPPDLARAHGIQIVPLLVLFGDRVYHDGVDLRPKEFYEQLESGPVHPRTNPPPQADFLETYRALAPHKDLVSVHISEKLSQTVVHARAAAEEGLPAFQKERGEAERVTLCVVDSNNASLGLGMLALFAARMARRGVEPDAIVDRLESMRGRIQVLFAVNTLDYLARGGRIGKGRAFLGNLLGIKPILGVVDGEVTAVDKVRGGRAAQPRLIELFREKIDPKRPVVVSIAHAKAPVWADRLRVLIQKSFDVAELIVAEMGPVVGTHAGPGTVGAALFQPTEEELPLVAPLSEPV